MSVVLLFIIIIILYVHTVITTENNKKLNYNRVPWNTNNLHTLDVFSLALVPCTLCASAAAWMATLFTSLPSSHTLRMSCTYFTTCSGSWHCSMLSRPLGPRLRRTLTRDSCCDVSGQSVPGVKRIKVRIDIFSLNYIYIYTCLFVNVLL